MRTGLLLAGVVLVLLLVVVITGAGFAPKVFSGTFTAPETVHGPVVVELFTSQGCSSCPPADKYLKSLAQSPEWQAHVIPLSFHVDYWNYLGWKDPFSDAAWTERQGDYVTALGGATLYTPQMVIHGHEDVVGSRFAQVEKVINARAKDARSHQAKLAVTRLIRDKDKLSGTVHLTGKIPRSRAPYALIAIAFQKELSTDVPRGENAGKTLQNDFVVRNLALVTKLQQTKKLDQQASFEVALDASMDPERMGIAILVQHTRTMEIIGATAHF
ncbi:MAG: DUF1223 domain-containing protein [Bacteroidota bacterium]